MTPQRSGHAANSAQARRLTVRRSPAAKALDVFGQSVRPRSFGRRSLAFLLGRTPRENTLYGLLGVRADADDEAIKEAFRRAVKAYHPDLHAGDPHAPLLFRQIVAANGILRDAQQRAIYDRFLEGERQQLRSRRRRAIVSDVISVAVLTIVLLGGYALLAPLMTTAVAVAEKDRHAAATDAAEKHKPTATTAVAVAEKDRHAAATDAAEKHKPTATTAVVTKGSEERPKPGGAVAEDNAQGRVEMATVQPVAPAKTIGADRVIHEQRDGDIATEMIAPKAATPAIDHGETKITAVHQPAHEPPVGPVSDDPKFYRERGIDAYRRGDFRGAIVDFDEAIRLDANDPQAYDLRGNALDEIGEFERALADYDAAIHIDPNSAALFHDRAILWRRRGELDKALVDLDRAVRFSFSDANVYSDRGLVWYEKGRHDRAVADFSRAFKLDSKFAAAYINRGLMSHRSGELGLAAADDKVIHIDPKILDAIQSANLHP
jgi:Flp pilus assembly protein TadD